jgi:hypothetical protein
MNITQWFADAYAKVKLFINEARTKVTTYVGLLIAMLAEAHDSWSQFSGALPGWLHTHERQIYASLGILVIWTRVRRALGAKVDV